MSRARFATRSAARVQRKAERPRVTGAGLSPGGPVEHGFEQARFDPDFSEPSFEPDWSRAKLPNWALIPGNGGAPQPVQAALEVREHGDPLEDEADRVASEVLDGGARIDRNLEVDRGRNFTDSIFARMEQRFGDDLGDVRLHRDSTADALTESMQARAFTTGNDVYFRERAFRPETPDGQRLIAHELTHVVQQRRGLQSVEGGAAPSATPAQGVVQRAPDPTAKRRAYCYESKEAAPPLTDECDPRTPEKCPTYEGWLASFSGLKTFKARDTAPGAEEESRFNVLGVRATRPVDKKTVPEPEQPPPPVAPLVSDRFIDHPTDAWVKTCLPENLRETAYRLRSDCADIAVILRHVWLSAHHRTEVFGGWTCGSKAGQAASSRVANVLGQVYSGNAQSMVNAYADTRGRPLQKLRGELENLLHPGDVLVWEHHSGGIGTARTGGHVMTIVSVKRDPGTKKITSIDVVQGNQPISEHRANAIRAFIGTGAPSVPVLRQAPGRRIETKRLPEKDLTDVPVPQGKDQADRLVWTLGDGHTTLVAAGPPAAAPRPSGARPPGGKSPERKVGDWLPTLKVASAESLQPALEAALLELRALIEGGTSVSDSEAEELGKVAGDRLFAMAKRASDLGDESHFRPTQRLRAVIEAIGDPNGFKNLAPAARTAGTPRATEVFRVFGLIERAFSLAARGASSISFGRSSKPGQALVRVLVTGFDPFTKDVTAPPPGTVNPSAAAALALDGTVVKNGSAVAAVEGAVLPVDYGEFSRGIVESTLRPLLKDRNVDAVLTVSLDPNLKATDPVEFERFVVGVHKVQKKEESAIEPIPASTSGTAGGAIMETTAPIERIAEATERHRETGQDEIRKPTIGNDVALEFSSRNAAKAALKALGLPDQNSARVTLSDPAAVRTIIKTMKRKGDGIEFRVLTKTFHARVVAGPGGNFLSNEVSFRVLRLLAETGRAEVTSFHRVEIRS